VLPADPLDDCYERFDCLIRKRQKEQYPHHVRPVSLLTKAARHISRPVVLYPALGDHLDCVGRPTPTASSQHFERVRVVREAK